MIRGRCWNLKTSKNLLLNNNNINVKLFKRGFATQEAKVAAVIAHSDKREAERLERKKRAIENSKKEDSRSNGSKLLEKFKVPRIIDLQDPDIQKEDPSIARNMEFARKRVEERALNTPKASNPKYQDQYKYTSGVIIERFPSLNPLPNEIEKTYMETYERLQEIVRRDPIRFVSIVEDLPEFKEQQREKNEDNLQDEFEEDFSNYTPEPRETEADLKNDRKSLDRKLDKSLYLIINKSGSRYDWQFPSTNWINGESMKNCAERSLRDSLGSNWKYFIPSQAPCGVYKYNVDDDIQELIKAQGIKEFFYRAHYFGGDFQINPKIVKDYLWVTKDELQEYFDEDYYNETVKLIFDDCFYAYIK
ncbi:hypothetical protein DDB_G0290311 [Dictyostelium discoideum AX4]|uniref:Large ribosomal subunit protein mL46 n=1 Tax=Dictyostelium discoideum TaxID=44689 RepID=Q54G88_DICDI|nr:hypothetical protein DDB_G0290311 [Dictyostelium discoideum AX4]EAL62282.1 hypothetical protein DDB_G0290311 [Dictyostelium discoideum AX4]|eukprot:XP_635795.1 hypothetical protein DDB_G0290311 [Dictyostelium discoideum AX4]